MDNPTFSIILATRDRENDLLECAKSIGEQTHVPYEVLIIDDGDLSEDYLQQIQRAIPEPTELYVGESRGTPGLSVGRNTGIRRAIGDVVVILDDDVILGDSYLERLKIIYEEYDDEYLAGVGGFDRESARPISEFEMFFRQIFRQRKEGWKINNVGMQSWNTESNELMNADWLPGNNQSYKREVAERYLFPQWNGGRETLEDVDIGWAMKKDGFYCLVDPKLNLTHKESKDDEQWYETGLKEGKNRVRLFRRHGASGDWVKFVWAETGDILKQSLAPLMGRSFTHHWPYAAGLLVGFVSQIAQPGPNPEF